MVFFYGLSILLLNENKKEIKVKQMECQKAS